MNKTIRIILIFISVLISSWFMLHIVALLGVFLALAYPIWWLIVPRYTPCVGCNVLRDGDFCPFCHEKISKSDIHPKSFGSTIKNAFLILFISLISLGIVFGETKLLYLLGIPATPKTVEFSIPDKGQYKLGEIFQLKIEINGIKTPINAVQADFSYDPNRLQIQSISTDDSFANIFIQKEINNDAGYARLTGGLPNPGYFSDHGLFGTVYFKSLEPGLTTVEFLPSSMILANDGRGTNVLKDTLGKISYLILPERITKTQEEQQFTFFSDQVLGAKTENTQFTFYAPDESVLGDSTTTPSASRGDTKSFRDRTSNNWFLNLLSHINDFILRFWQSIFRLFK